MRKIKFRAWNKRKGIMALVAHISNLLTVGEFVDVRMNEPDAVTKMEEEWSEGEYVLMQFTNLKDKNGVSIYEGDVVNFPQFCIHPLVIEYDPGVFMARQKTDGVALGVGANHEYFEVIGNIYENPELLDV